jgi:hypothetical protein
MGQTPLVPCFSGPEGCHAFTACPIESQNCEASRMIENFLAPPP